MQALLLRAVEARDRAEQPPRVRVLRVVEELPSRRALDDAAGVHDNDLVCDLRDDAQVVRDQDDRGVELVLELVDQLDDLRLDRHVERRRRLVGDQQIRLIGQGHGDHHALALASGELMRVGPQTALGLGQADQAQQLDRARTRGARSECSRNDAVIAPPRL